MSGRIAGLLRRVSIVSPLERVLRRLGPWRAEEEDGALQINPEMRTVLLDEPGVVEAVLRRHVRDGMNCVDVGARVGSFTALLTRLSPRGKHVAIEPVPHKAKWLKEKYPEVEVVECAVADATGRATFFYRSAAADYLGHRSAGLRSGSAYEVEVRRIDDVVPSERTIELVKLDVEGGELDAFRGAKRILSRDRPLVLFECAIDGLSAFHQSASEMHAFLTDKHYAVYTPIDLLGGGPPLDETAFERALRQPFRAFNFVAMPFELSAAFRRAPAERGARIHASVSRVAVGTRNQLTPPRREVLCFPYAW